MPETLLKSTFLAILQGFPTFHFYYSNFIVCDQQIGIENLRKCL
nr:MAG TPA: hypothetical protein [Caudoviricetes sp.]